MPVDPSIIANSMSTMASKMPDVNALMQQRVQGAENIYKIETARQEEAAEAAKEQQAAIAQMMLPSVAAAFSDPSDAGLEAATSLMPPEAAETFAPFMDRLRGVPDVKLRQALLRAELMKDPEGRLILGQLEPTANMRLQADTAAQAQALKMRELQLREQEAARGETPSYKEVVLKDGTLVLMDQKSGRIIQPSMEGPIDTAVPLDETTGQPIKVQTEEMKQQAKERVKLDAAFPKASRSFRSSVTALDQDIADVQKLLADKAGLEAITGTFNAMTPDIMRDATRGAALYDKITAGAAFTALNDLKAASPAGGALGNVSNEEGRRLKDSVATFSRKQATPDFVRGLEDYLVDLQMARENVLAAFDETYAYRDDVSAESAAEDISTQRERIEKETRSTQKPPRPPGVTVKKRN